MDEETLKKLLEEINAKLVENNAHLEVTHNIKVVPNAPLPEPTATEVETVSHETTGTDVKEETK